MKTLILGTAAALLATSALSDVQTRTFTFENEGSVLAGTIYLPEGHDGAALPTVLVTGSWTSVEEQMPALYAQEMVERGFAAVTFDFRGWGKSGNLPADTPGGMRFIESPAAKTSDIEAAIYAIATLPEVDASRISGLGICASAGYMADAAAGHPLVKSIGFVAPWLQDRSILEAVYGGSDGIDALLEVAAGAEAAGGHVIHAAYTEGSLMQASDYYSNFDRGLIAAYDNKWNNAGWDDWLTYTPVDAADALDKPLAIVHSPAAAIPQGVDAYLAGYSGTASVTWLEDTVQSDFYDQQVAVDRAADEMARHFVETAGTNG
ncbi:MAG: CocE/NonD family hydrolase [Roseobacter sp.]|jgi:fermentation-respiration switch protein FrsA (DUF1100 family)|nr:CocE/NonD family hydrolase [Roseobacter sp.]